MANSVDPVQTAPIGAVCSGSMLFASILNSSVMLGNYLQQTTSADDIFRCIFFLGALRVKRINPCPAEPAIGSISSGTALFAKTKQSSRKEKYHFIAILSCNPLKYKMDN